MIGKTLGNFKITSQIGKGGMGEVYQAEDQKLGRSVAIKVLPEEFARDTDRVARFQREAKLLASLNHPNIAAIHGLEESDGTHFLVLELIEGDTLADRIKKGPIPAEEALKLALQIVEALEAAHERGVIHRDLKPANIKVTTDGKVKVLDFGLAKAYAGESEDMDLSNSPTLSAAATQQGVVLGTAAYMPPEQARGMSVDMKADIWAFGCVLFEMLAGRSAFSGRDVTDILAAVIRSEPEWNSLPANLHWRLKEVLERCLEKEAKDRYSGINDARVDIQKVLTDPSGIFVQTAVEEESQTKHRLGLPWIAAAVLLTSVIVALVVWFLRAPEPPQVTRLYHDLPSGQQFVSPIERNIAISPDGRKLVYATASGLYLRSLDELIAQPIPGTSGAQKPFFSPDGKWVGFQSMEDSQLKKVALSGGAPVILTAASTAGFIRWEEDDTIIYAELGRGILRVSANGGTPEVILKQEEQMFISPQMLPDGKTLLFTKAQTPYKIIIQSLGSGESKELFAGDTAQYLRTGHIVYALENNLFAIPFNLAELEIEGGSISMIEGIGRGLAPQYAVSDSGTMVYVPEILDSPNPLSASLQRTLVWVDRNGKETPIEAGLDGFLHPRISPDGTQVAVSITDGRSADIWIWHLVRETKTRLTFDEADDIMPLWTPDGKRVAFMSQRQQGMGAYWKAAAGTGKTEPIVSTPNTIQVQLPYSWADNGKTMVIADLTAGSLSGISLDLLPFDIAALSMEGDKDRKLLLHEKYNEVQPRVSPDGRWMAYTSDESGQNQIYVRPFPDVEEGRWQISREGGDSPLWAPDGSELFYRSADAVMAVSVETEPVFSFETPATLFQGEYVGASFDLITFELNPWDISPDGKRFLMMKGPSPFIAESMGSSRVNIILNWFEELKERVPLP